DRLLAVARQSTRGIGPARDIRKPCPSKVDLSIYGEFQAEKGLPLLHMLPRAVSGPRRGVRIRVEHDERTAHERRFGPDFPPFGQRNRTRAFMLLRSHKYNRV